MTIKTRRPKPSPSMKLCAQPWCAALARAGGTYCVIHERHPKLRPEYRKEDGSMKPWSEER